jgi:hypothetical protein
MRTYVRISATPGRSAVRPTLHLTTAVTPHAGQFLARCLEVDDLSACGSSVQAAVRALAELAARELADL